MFHTDIADLFQMDCCNWVQMCIRDSLEALCEKIQAGGVAPIMFTGVDWSLGSHYLSQVFSGIQGDTEAQQNFINSLKDGSAELKSNDAWNSVMDTFDIIAKYNYCLLYTSEYGSI